ncbi:MAG: glutamate 5-kinase [Devosia sp. 67-54]|uniref:glutamate 5-kinase n=1 Tax=unclassified Devosia TaxID=196773 RepID=UPI000962EB7F|nr:MULTISPECIES: glutamate 5-kinase [unclassified Devosia]MBN9307200.1 glutamate 5-kinase [Devosia sp.]OJX19595.1 MAG: glutamate 5-kinase [Devosia sp. 67-54]
MADALAPYHRLTVKIGSATIVDSANGKVRGDWLAALAEDLAGLKARGVSVVVVSSGAIALGRGLLGLSATSLTLEQQQAAASAGQIALSQAWAESLGRHGVVTGQILITPNITEERRYFLNARTTISTLLSLGAIPIINENDSVATAEIRYGDNDRLSARVATMIEADCLVLLSDIDGLYTAPPGKDPTARHLPFVPAITPDIEAMAGGAASHLSRGGMTTKIEAGKIATLAGTAMIIARGTGLHPLRALQDGGTHTLFAAAESRAQARKRWIMGTLDLQGQIWVDAGAVRALLDGKSLLPIGVTRVTGEFVRGDAVAVLAPDGREIARGLVGLDREEADLVKGKNSRAAAEILGLHARAELVHRDNLVVLMGAEARPA